ncbi:MAG: PQQ-binding-like beta-propeller repeat protein, partial [Planctomycetota bacterium]
MAALQIPVTHIKNDRYQQIKITRVLPNCRLIAYDLETGEELWNHTPPEGWDGEEGSFSDRMRVAGPPVIAGSRVLVPSYRMQGRIDYHVGCYDLLTGEYLWSTALISGQRELNMFGRPEFEFCAAPLRVEGDVVIALTQLGSIAALDLLTGSTLWQVVYDQYELPKSSWGANRRDRTWLNSSPLVVRDGEGRGVVVAAPVDGPYLLGLDFETGAALWTVAYEGGRRIQQGSNLLLGATEDTVYLGGPKVSALRAIGGLRSRPTRHWQTSYGVFDGAAFKGGGDLPRGALGADHVVFAAPNGRALVERDSGRVDENYSPWKNGGNVLLTPGATFTLSNNWLNGYFEWEALIRQANAELSRRPGEVDPAVRLARLRVDRAERHWQDGELEEARRQLEKAHDVLKTYAEGERTGIRPEVATTMHDVLRARARIAIQGGELAQARSMLRRARDLAPDSRELRDTLLAEEALWRRSSDEAWLEIVSDLESRCAGLTLLCTIEIVDGQSVRLVPLFDQDFTAPPTAELPVELWARLERARRHEEAGRYGLAFEDYHAVIEEFGFEEIGARSVRGLAADGIARNLQAGGGVGYAPFEERAAEMLERARNSEDTEQVAAVSRFFPHSQASRAAHDVLLEVALEQGDATEVAAIVDSELPENWAPQFADARQIDLVLGLARTLGRSGNTEYER